MSPNLSNYNKLITSLVIGIWKISKTQLYDDVKILTL